MDLREGDTIAIVGQGPVGLSATQLAAAMGARVIALDVSSERLARAKEFGADVLINPATDDPVKAIKSLTRGAGADRALDTSASPEGRLVGVRSTRPWGIVCLVGEGGHLTVDVSPDLLRKQLTVIGSWTFSAHASSPARRSRSIICSPIAGSSIRPTRPTACSISRRAARASF
jgi:threonine dehydrogenase-like Zn-dependent dehydrogenase